MASQRLALFPLNVVLFPGMGLPLHIFEERYKEMIGECLEGERRFGVCLIRSGAEVGEPAEPYLNGTEAEILSARKLGDDRFILMAVGRRRFRVEEITQWRPYVAGQVRFLEAEAPEGEAFALAEQARGEVVGYLHRMLELADRTDTPLSLPRDPVALSYAAAALLPIAAPLKQELLEEAATTARLTRILEYLRQARLEQEALLRLHHSRPDLLSNDNGGDPGIRH
jgi:Lon protease-like protein